MTNIPTPEAFRAASELLAGVHGGSWYLSINEALAEAIDSATGLPALLAERTALREALQAAQQHLEYCGYGDKWERECAVESNLEERINSALTNQGAKA